MLAELLGQALPDGIREPDLERFGVGLEHLFGVDLHARMTQIYIFT